MGNNKKRPTKNRLTMNKSLFKELCWQLCHRNKIHTSASAMQIQKQTRLRVVDNSALGKSAMLEGRPPKCIHVYNKTHIGRVGDKVLVVIKGQKKRGILVGCHQTQKPLVPKFDSNNLVLIDDNGTPLGTRIHVPIPTMLRKK